MSGKTVKVLAFDFGASSGRAIKAVYDGDALTYEEVHRFENVPQMKDGHLRWDYETLLAEVRRGISLAGDFDSVAFDTWGVDYGLLDENGRLLADPVHYRDQRTEGITEKVLAKIPAERLYAATGTQIMPINTLFQLAAQFAEEPELSERAKTLLFMPDLFAYALSGRLSCERTIASTAQLLDLEKAAWRTDLLETLGLPSTLLLPPVASGTVLGELPGTGAKVLAAAGHDTQCAVAALPGNDEDRAFLSCGTWSLLGCELDKPILSETSMALGLSNELGANGKINYLKNIIGLWLIQESRREWKRQGKAYSFAEMEKMALEAAGSRSFIDPDDPLFVPPGDLPGRVRDYCRATGQPVPESDGQVLRTIYESLALKYRYALEQIEQASGRHFTALNILGGGTKDKLLCRLTAEATGRRVLAGPVEATALGNIMIQLIGLGALGSFAEGRELIGRCEPPTVYESRDSGLFSEETYARYRALLEK